MEIAEERAHSSCRDLAHPSLHRLGILGSGVNRWGLRRAYVASPNDNRETRNLHRSKPEFVAILSNGPRTSKRDSRAATGAAVDTATKLRCLRWVH